MSVLYRKVKALVAFMKKVRIKLKNTPQVKKYNEALKKAKNLKVGMIEEKYGVNLKVHSDMRISTYLRTKGYSSLADILEGTK